MPIIIDINTGPENGSFNEAIRDGLILIPSMGALAWQGSWHSAQMRMT